MSNREFNEKRTELANDFAAAGQELLSYMGTSAALAAIPSTEPPRYVVAGTLAEIVKLLPGAEGIHSLLATAAGEQAEPDQQRKLIERAIVGLRDGWATRADADAALAALGSTWAAPAAPEQVPAIGRLLDEFSVLPVLWGLNEPGALMRHSDVFKMLVNAGKTYLAAPSAAAPAAPSGFHLPNGWRQYVARAYVEWRKHDQSTPDDVLDLMRDILYAAEEQVVTATAAPEQDEVRNQAPCSESATDWAMKHACRDLPDNYEVSIELENGYGGVLWRERGGDWHAVEGDGDMSDHINEAVERAIEASAMKTATNEGSQA